MYPSYRRLGVEWASGLILTGAETFTLTVTRPPDLPAHSEALHLSQLPQAVSTVKRRSLFFGINIRYFPKQYSTIFQTVLILIRLVFYTSVSQPL